MPTAENGAASDSTAVRRLPVVIEYDGVPVIAAQIPSAPVVEAPADQRKASSLVAALTAAIHGRDAVRVLQLGANPAATRVLAARGALVDVVEMSAAAAISGDFVEDESDTRLFIGGVDDVPAQPTYELIVALSESATPMTSGFLDAIVSRLLPDGCAIVAVKNRLGRHALGGHPAVGLGAPALSRGELKEILDTSPVSVRIGELTLGDDGSFLLIDREVMERIAPLAEPWMAWLARPAPGSEAVGIDEHLWRGLSGEDVAQELCDILLVAISRGPATPLVMGDEVIAAFWNFHPGIATPSHISVHADEFTIDGAGGVPLATLSGTETFSDSFRRSSSLERRSLIRLWRELLNSLESGDGVPLTAIPRNFLVGAEGTPTLVDFNDDGTRAPVEEVLERGVLWLALEIADLSESCSRVELASRIGLVMGLRTSEIWIAAAIAREARRLSNVEVGPHETEAYWVQHLWDRLGQPVRLPPQIIAPDPVLLVAQHRLEFLESRVRESARVSEQQRNSFVTENNELRRQAQEARRQADAARHDADIARANEASLRDSRAFRAIASFRARVNRIAPGGTHRRGLYERSLRLAARAARSRRRPPPAPTADLARFTVPSSENPLISIVIPAYGHLEYTIRCLQAIATHHEGHEVEVLVVDDASPDNSVAQLRGVEGLRVLALPENLGFTRAANAGIKAARGDHVLMLNNDAEPTAGWISALLDAVRPDVGIVGARLVYPDGRLQEAGGIIFNDGNGWNYGKFDDPEDPRYTFRKEVDYCSGAAILITRALLNIVPGFDERFAPAYYEDVDMAFQARANGLKVIYQPKAVVIHHEGISHGSDESSGIKHYQVVNRDKFVEKWGNALTMQRRPGEVALASVRRTGIGTVVIVDHMVPTWHEDAGSLRMVRLIRTLRGMGYDIVFLPDSRHRGEPYSTELQADGVLIWYGWGDRLAYLRDIELDVSVAILSRASIALSFIRQIREVLPDTPIIFDTVDLHFLREQRRVDAFAPGASSRGARATRELELALVRSADLTIVVSDAEKAILEDLVPDSLIQVIPTAHDSVERTNNVPRTDITFVGSFQHDPNADAVRWLIEEILPLIVAELPEVHFTIVGKNPPSDMLESAPAGVSFLGWVEDLLPIYERSLVAIAPLRYGAGVKGKVGEAWAHGVPVVLTTLAAEGMGVDPGVNALVADDPEAFAAAVISLYRYPELWEALSTAGARHVDEKFGAPRIRELLSIAIASVRER